MKVKLLTIFWIFIAICIAKNYTYKVRDRDTLYIGSLKAPRAVMSTNGIDVAGKLLVQGITIISNALTVTGNMTISNIDQTGIITTNFVIAGDLDVTGNTSCSNISNSGFLELSEGAVFYSTLDVTGITTLNSVLDVAGNTICSNVSNWGFLDVVGAAVLNSTLDTTGATTLNSTLTTVGNTINSNVSNWGFLNLVGAATLNSTLDVVGDTTCSNVANSGILDVTGAVNLNNVLAVAGASIISNTLAVTSNVTIAKTLDVTGAVNLASSLAVLGTSVISNNLDVVSNVTIGGTLVVTGQMTADNTVKSYERVTTTGTDDVVDPDIPISLVYSTAAHTVVLSNGSFNGQMKNIILSSNGGILTVEPINLELALSLVFSNRSESVQLVYDTVTTNWVIYQASGMTISN